MSYKLNIKVTKEILEKSKMCGKNKVGLNCAIALAIRDIFPSAWITGSKILIDPIFLKEGCGIKSKLAIKLPIEAIHFIHEFDRIKPKRRVLMNEISFDIDIPDAVIEELNIDELKEVLKESKTLELIEVC